MCWTGLARYISPIYIIYIYRIYMRYFTKILDIFSIFIFFRVFKILFNVAHSDYILIFSPCVLLAYDLCPPHFQIFSIFSKISQYFPTLVLNAYIWRSSSTSLDYCCYFLQIKWQCKLLQLGNTLDNLLNRPVSFDWYDLVLISSCLLLAFYELFSCTSCM